ncbi:MAG TPA: hypothetical protein DCS12_09830 [Clostridiales bacterium]|nr:hypothetical protein [Clostridiales bacterium]
MNKLIILIIFFFFIVPQSIFAEQSSYWFDNSAQLFYTNTAGTTSGSVGNMADEDGVYYQINDYYQHVLYFSPTTSVWNIPVNTEIKGISIQLKVLMPESPPGTSKYYFARVSKSETITSLNDFISSYTNSCNVGSDYSACSIPFNEGLLMVNSTTNPTEGEIAWINPPVGHPDHVTAEDFINGNVKIGIWNSSTARYDYHIDYMRVSLWYDLATANIDINESTASASLGYAGLDVSGSIPISPITSDTWCQISLYEKCSATGKAGWTSSSPVTKLRTYASATSCSQSPPTLYCSSGFDGNYSFTGIQVPFHSGFTCTYPALIQCYERNCETVEYWSTTANDYLEKQVCDDYDSLIYEEQSVNADGVNYNENLTLEPEATIDAPEDLQPDCGSDPICAVTKSIKDFFSWLFVPDQTALNLTINDYRDVLSSRAPFAYVYAFFNNNFTSPDDTSDFEFVLSVDFDGSTYSQGIPEEFTAFSQIIDTMKGVLTFLLYAIFIFYMILLPKRILPQ